MAIHGFRRYLLLPAACATLGLGIARTTSATSCPGDSNNDGTVTVDEIILAVDAALNGCADTPSGLLQTGQAQCDQGTGDGTLGTCPGSPNGQDGAVRAGIPLAFTDNGDGTISSAATGLMWEKLSDDGSVHDWNNTYTWQDAFDVKVAALNASPCFAGHCDWRLPNRRELDSLLNLDREAPAVLPVFYGPCTPNCTVTECSCTQIDNPYWTSTSYLDLADSAWAVDFNTGAINGYDKTIPIYYVRAVRGGI